MLSIQGGASLAKSLFPIIGASSTTTLRIGFAAILLCLIWKPWRHPFSHADRKIIFVYGIALGVMNLLFYMALEKIPLGVAVALEFTGPLSVAIWASRKKVDFLWALLAGAGIYFVLPMSSTGDAPLDLWGVALALGAGVCWALYIIFGQRLSHSIPSGVAASTGMVVAALVVLPFGVISSGADLLQLHIMPVALAVAVLSSALPYSVEMIALKSIPAQTFGILMSLEPAIAALSGWLFLVEKLSLSQMGAIACIIIASLGSTLTNREPVKT
ncbi:MAG: EamA family transporter [Pseudobdellovibrionaceae bacterium]